MPKGKVDTMKKFLSILLAIAMLPCMAFAAGAASSSTGYDITISDDPFNPGEHIATVTVSGTALPSDYALITILDHQDPAKHAQYSDYIKLHRDFDAPYNVTIQEAFGLPNDVDLNETQIATCKKHFGHAQAGADGKYSISFAFDPDATADKVYLLVGAGGSFAGTYAATAVYIPSEATLTAAETALADGATVAELEAYDYVYGLNTASNAFQSLPDKMVAALTTMTTTAANVKTNFNTAEAFYNKQLEALAIINNVNTTADDLYDLLTVTHVDVIGDYGSVLTAADITAKYNAYDYISVNNLLIGYNYPTMADFKTAFVAAAPTTDGSGDGGTGDGSGGGGGGGGGGGMIVPTPILPEVVPAEMFSDLDSVPWAKDSITNLAKREVINGMGDGTFNPTGDVTREQFVKMLLLAFGADIKNIRSKFVDVDPTQWYAVYVNTACDNGIVNGISDTEFGVGNSITRQDLVTMLYRACEYFGITLPSGSAVSFNDAGEIATYALDAVNAMAGAGIVNGVSEGKFGPGQFATRAQVAVILDRLSAYQQ